MANYPFDIPGFNGGRLALKTSLWTSAKITFDGNSLPKRKGQFILTLPDGTKALLGFKRSFDIFTPDIVFNGEVIQAAPKLSTCAYVVALWPLILMIGNGEIGGSALGGGLGGAAAYVNLGIMRSNHAPWLRYVLCVVSGLIAVVIWFALLTVFYLFTPEH
jgi:hypothetical protein